MIRTHESMQLHLLEITKCDRSVLLEMIRKKYLAGIEKRHGGISPYDEMLAGKDVGAIDRHTKNMIYRTIKQIGHNAKEEQIRNKQMSMNIDWNEF